eukprot:Awhi_evm1s12684
MTCPSLKQKVLQFADEFGDIDNLTDYDAFTFDKDHIFMFLTFYCVWVSTNANSSNVDLAAPSTFKVADMRTQTAYVEPYPISAFQHQQMDDHLQQVLARENSNFYTAKR